MLKSPSRYQARPARYKTESPEDEFGALLRPGRGKGSRGAMIRLSRANDGNSGGARANTPLLDILPDPWNTARVEGVKLMEISPKNSDRTFLRILDTARPWRSSGGDVGRYRIRRTPPTAKIGNASVDG